MTWLISTLMTGIAAAIATTFDDNFYLTLFFGKVNRHFRPQHIILGEYLGFSALIAISLLGFVSRLIISPTWIGLLGFLPIFIGISQLLSRKEEEEQSIVINVTEETHQPRFRHKSLWANLRDPQTYEVSAVTIANGGNNLGIYIPLFASTTLPSLGIILFVLYLTIGVWCFLSYNLTRHLQLARFLSRYVRKVFPFVLIWIGFSIVMENQSYQLLSSLTAFTR